MKKREGKRAKKKEEENQQRCEGENAVKATG